MPTDHRRPDLHHLPSSRAPLGEHDVDASWHVLANPAFLRHVDAFVLDDPKVSIRSVFTDNVWWLDYKPPAQAKQFVVSFLGIPFELANELKVALLASISHPALSRLSMSTAEGLGKSLALLGSWMAHVGFGSIGQLGSMVGELFLQALGEHADLIQQGSHDPKAGDWDPSHLGRWFATARKRSTGLATSAAEALLFLHDAGAALEMLTGARPRGAPFSETSASAVGKRWKLSRKQTTERLPSAVLDPLLRGCTRLMGLAASDVVRLVGAFCEFVEAGLDREEAARRSLAGFRFSKLEGEDWSWWSHAGSHMTWFHRFAQLVHLIRDAAVVLVLLGVGMRPQELLGLMGGTRTRDLTDPVGGSSPGRRDWLPLCVAEELSKSGHTVMLILYGHVFKREETPRPVSWLLDGRQDGAADPTTFAAVCVLDELHRPLRAYAADCSQGMLIVDFAGPRNAIELAVGHCPSGRLAMSVRESLKYIVDLSGIPDEDEERDLRRYKAEGASCLALYQCRKTYAQDLYAFEPSLLPAISRQFQHEDPAGTRKSYVTKDPQFRRELELGRTQFTSLLVREALGDDVGDEGTMARAIDAVMLAVGGRSPSDGRDALWARMTADPPTVLNDRLRPVAGMALLQGVPLPSTPAPGDRGPAVTRAFLDERRRWLEDVSRGRTSLGGAARDRAMHAARWIEENGFGPAGPLERDPAGVAEDGLE